MSAKTNEYILFSDVHGHAENLIALLTFMNTFPEAQKVCLGDMIDAKVPKDAANASVPFDQAVHIPENFIDLFRDTLMVRGNQEERVVTAVPNTQIPALLKDLLFATELLEIPNAFCMHGHECEWRFLTPNLRHPVPLTFPMPFFFHGHRHRQQLLMRPRYAPHMTGFTEVQFNVGEPLHLNDAFEYLINPGPIFIEPGCVLYVPSLSQITFFKL